MLMFLHSLEEVLPASGSFAFSSDLGEVSDLFARNDIDDAIALTLAPIRQRLNRLRPSARRLSQALPRRYRQTHTCIIILGDARNNYGDARTDVLKEIPIGPVA